MKTHFDQTMQRLGTLNALNAQQDGNQAANQEAGLNSMLKYYGMQQAHALQPYQIQQLQLENAGRAAMLPGQVEHQGIENALGQNEADWANLMNQAKYGEAAARTGELTAHTNQLSQLTPLEAEKARVEAAWANPTEAAKYGNITANAVEANSRAGYYDQQTNNAESVDDVRKSQAIHSAIQNLAMIHPLGSPELIRKSADVYDHYGMPDVAAFMRGGQATTPTTVGNPALGPRNPAPANLLVNPAFNPTANNLPY